MPKATITSTVEHDGRRLEVGAEITASEAILAALVLVGCVERKGSGKGRGSSIEPDPAVVEYQPPLSLEG